MVMSATPDKSSLVTIDRVERRILLIRGHRVIIDSELADLYGVPTRALNQAVKRNADRFPPDFAFRLSPWEAGAMRSQFVTASRRNVRHRPAAFTEHGAIMAANVLDSPRAVRASVLVVRAFVWLRFLLSTHRELARKLAELEERIGRQDGAIQGIMKAIRDLMEQPPDPPKERIGFHPPPRKRSSTDRLTRTGHAPNAGINGLFPTRPACLKVGALHWK